MSVPLKTLLEDHAGGVRGGWSNLKAVLPGGGSTPMIPAWQAETALMDFDGLRELKTALRLRLGDRRLIGRPTWCAPSPASAAFTSMSCGQCAPCREGTGWMWRVMERMASGEAEVREIDMLLDVASEGRGPHHLRPRRLRRPGRSRGLFRHFRHEVEARITSYRTQRPHVQGARIIA